MTQIITALSDISPQYRAVFCDLWGCLHNGKAPFAAAVAALQQFRRQGGIVILLTNAPRPYIEVEKQLDGMGAPRDCYDMIVTSGDAAQHALITGAAGHEVYHIGPDKDLGFFADLPADLQAIAAQSPISRVALDQAKGIVCTGLVDDQTETPNDYRAALLYGKTKGMVMLCANPDIVVDMGDKRIYCAGALAKAYEEMGGQTLYFGKPHPPIYDLARRKLAAHTPNIAQHEILCIGDGPLTDILGGQNDGFDTLFITGGIAAHHFGGQADRPDPDLLNGWLDDNRLSPTYSMGKLA